jgi:hypothetical protein
VTAGPTTGPVLNAGGAPGGKSAVCASLSRAPAAAASPSDVRVRKSLRDFIMNEL